MISAALWVAFFFGFAFLAFKRHPLFGLAIYLGTVFVHPPSRWWGSMLPDPRWALLSAAVTAAAIYLAQKDKLVPKPPWFSNGPAVLLCISIAWMALQSTWALDFESHYEGTIKYIKYMIAFWFIYKLADTPEHLRMILLMHVIGCALLGIYAFYTPRVAGRLDGVGGPGIDDANTLGMYLATGALVCVGLMVTASGWRRWAYLVPLALIGEGFVLANSRGAFLGLVGGGLVLAWSKASQYRRPFWALALVGLIGFAMAVDKTFIERMYTIGDVTEESEEADMSARSRRVIVEAQLRMFADYPMGSGYRGTVVLSPIYMDRQWLTSGGSDDESQAARASHNTFMTALVEFGVPGALLHLCLFGWIFLAALRARQLATSGGDPATATITAAAAAGLAVVFVAGIATDYFMAEVQFWLFPAVVSGLGLSAALPRTGLDGAVRPGPAGRAGPYGAP